MQKKSCKADQIFTLTTQRCIKINSPIFKKRLQEQLEKNVQHFDEEDLIKLGYNVQTVEISDNTQNKITNAINDDKKNKLSDKVRTAILLKTTNIKENILNKFRYVEDNQRYYCNNNESKKLFDIPLITKTLTYNFTYLKSILQGPFSLEHLVEYDNKIPWKVDFLSSIEKKVITLKTTNYDRMNLMMKDIDAKFNDQLDIKWFNEMNLYLSKLNVDALFALKAYTFIGDRLINNRARGTLDLNKMKQMILEPNVYFPLFFPFLEIIFEKNELTELTNEKNGNALNLLTKMIKNILLFKKNANAGKATYMAYWYNMDLQVRKTTYTSMLDILIIMNEELVILAIDKLSKHVDDIIKNSPPTKKKMILYRGDKSDEYFNKNTGDIFFKNKGIISTSLSYDKVLTFTLGVYQKKRNKRCCINEITVLPGSRVLFIAGVSSIPNEIEFVLGMNTTYLMREFRKKTFVKDLKICDNKKKYRDEVLVTSLVALGQK